MAVTFCHVRSGAGMPAEVIAHRAPFRALERSETIEERILIHLHIGTVEDADPFVAVDEYISGADRSLRDFEEEPVVCSLDPIIDEHAVDITNVPPNSTGVRIVDDEVLPANGTIGLVEDLYGGREVPPDVFDVGARDD